MLIPTAKELCNWKIPIQLEQKQRLMLWQPLVIDYENLFGNLPSSEQVLSELETLCHGFNFDCKTKPLRVRNATLLQRQALFCFLLKALISHN